MSKQSHPLSVHQTADNELTIKVNGHKVRIKTESKIENYFVDVSYPDPLSPLEYWPLFPAQIIADAARDEAQMNFKIAMDRINGR